MTELTGRNRLFVLEFDFANYFDSIRHDYVLGVLKDHFLVSDRERELLNCILKNQRAHSVTDYRNNIFESPEVGIPQGSNVSLFLANVACYELDRRIEKVGVTFARYADDILILSESYEKANICADLLLSHGSRSGTEVNLQKSPGISLLTSAPNAEIHQKRTVTYLSHELSSKGITVAPKAISRMKHRVSKIIYNNLLLQPKRGEFDPKRIGAGFHDWDLVTCVNEIRRYVYGRITEASLSAALNGQEKFNFALCAMAFYPLVNGKGAAVLRDLDGWLVSTLERSYAKRCDILGLMGYSVQKLVSSTLIEGSWYQFPKVPVETKLPSFFKAWKYTRKAAEIYGLERFPSPAYDYI